MSLVDPMEKVRQDMEIANRQVAFCNHLAKTDEKFNQFWRNHRSQNNYDLVLSEYSKMYPANPRARAIRATIVYDEDTPYDAVDEYSGSKMVHGRYSAPGKMVNAIQIANKTIMLPEDEEIQKAYNMNQSTDPDASYTAYDRSKTRIINEMIPLVKKLDDLSQQYETLQKRNAYGQNVLDWDRVKTAFPPTETKSETPTRAVSYARRPRYSPHIAETDFTSVSSTAPNLGSGGFSLPRMSRSDKSDIDKMIKESLHFE